MRLDPGAVTARELERAAGAFGYRYTVVSPSGGNGGEGDALFGGAIGLQSLPCGARICVSDLTAVCGSAHAGELSRSLTVALMLDGTPADCDLGSRDRLLVPSGGAAIVSIADAACLASRYVAGQRARWVLVQARPEDLADEDLADRVDRATRATAVVPLAVSARALALARELFAPGLVGAVGRLLAESCALELLARGLTTAGADADQPAIRLSRRERAQILRVRETLVAEPDRPHRLCDLAREAGISVTTLKIRFPLVTGKTVFEFLRDARLDRAHAGLEQEGWTVAQAAHRAGYAHQTNFSTAFRRKFGVSPGAVRRSGRGLHP